MDLIFQKVFKDELGRINSSHINETIRKDLNSILFLLELAFDNENIIANFENKDFKNESSYSTITFKDGDIFEVHGKPKSFIVLRKFNRTINEYDPIINLVIDNKNFNLLNDLYYIVTNTFKNLDRKSLLPVSEECNYKENNIENFNIIFGGIFIICLFFAIILVTSNISVDKEVESNSNILVDNSNKSKEEIKKKFLKCIEENKKENEAKIKQKELEIYDTISARFFENETSTIKRAFNFDKNIIKDFKTECKTFSSLKFDYNIIKSIEISNFIDNPNEFIREEPYFIKFNFINGDNLIIKGDYNIVVGFIDEYKAGIFDLRIIYNGSTVFWGKNYIRNDYIERKKYNLEEEKIAYLTKVKEIIDANQDKAIYPNHKKIFNWDNTKTE